MPPKKAAAKKPKACEPKIKVKTEKKQKKDSGKRTPVTKGRPWLDDEEELLADMWRSETHMYDRGTKDNTNQEVRDDTLKSFCEKLGRSGKYWSYLLNLLSPCRVWALN